jgi:hypothetical protein
MNEKNYRVSEDMQSCIELCLDCHRTCLETAAYSLDQGPEHADPAFIRMLQDCADFCQTSADFMIRGSYLYSNVCSVCSIICEEAASDCDDHGDDPTIKECAEICRRCADSCREMADELLAA